LLLTIEAAVGGESRQGATRHLQRAGRNFGGLFAVAQLAKKMGIVDVLGGSPLGKWALTLICGRILTQGSRRHLTFWQKGQALNEALGVESFSTDDLYGTLDWLDENQRKIECSLFERNVADKTDKMFLYDITSSYLEGECNELAKFGYSRDGKKSKKQIVVGLLTSKDGFPISIEVFAGNTSDSTTVPDQISKLVDRFEQREIIFVGDRGMVKSNGIETLELKPDNGWYITAITKPQIEKMLKASIFHMNQFTEKPTEIEHNKIRYVLRRNPQRAAEISQNRQSKMKKIFDLLVTMNDELLSKPKMRPSTAFEKIQTLIGRLKLGEVLLLTLNDRTLTISIDNSALAEAAKLDGCYVVKTNLDDSQSDTEATHTSYKNLKFVEWAFRTMKSSFLELRPVFHRKANRTRALAFVAMLAYMIVFEIWKLCKHLNVPLEEIVAALDQIQTVELQIGGHWLTTLPSILRHDQTQYIEALGLKLPASI
jgi:transposase